MPVFAKLDVLVRNKSKISGMSNSGIGALLARTLKVGGDISALMSEIAATRAALAAEPRRLTAEFDPALHADECMLCERREYLIHAMYNHAFQCVQTGRRFAKKSELDAHLDKVQQGRRKKKEGSVSRGWFTDAASWMSGGANRSWFEDELVIDAEEERTAVMCSVRADESQPHCAVSGERFETFWHCEKQEWHYKAAVTLAVPFGAVPTGSLVLASAL